MKIMGRYFDKHNIKWMWQRITRGWDDRVGWSIDYYIAENLPLWIENMRGFGIPGDLEEDEWDEILDTICEGFNAYPKMLETIPNTPEHKEFCKKFDKGWDLFREWFSALWN